MSKVLRRFIKKIDFKEIGGIAIFAIGVNAPFWAYVLGWL